MMQFRTEVFGQHLRLKLLTFSLLVSGCGGVMTGSPPMPTYADPVVKNLVNKYSQPTAVPTDQSKLTVEQRNQIIEELKYLIDVNYTQFEKNFFVGRAVFDTAADLTALALGGTGSLIRPSDVQAILAAVSAGIAGGRVSINKNFFHEKSSEALIAKMRALRADKLRLIRGAQVLNLSDYPMSRALGDLGEYYQAGTIVGALQGIIADAGEKEKTATAAIEKKLEEKIELQYKTDPIRARIDRWLNADPKTNVPELSKWLAARNVKVVAPFWVNDSKTSAADLLDAIRDLKIP
jgi:hypothetical protein